MSRKRDRRPTFALCLALFWIGGAAALVAESPFTLYAVFGAILTILFIAYLDDKES